MMSKPNPWICLIFRVYLGGVFVYASLHKIAHPAAFALDVASYDILPLYLVNLQAVILPWVEAAAGILMITGFRGKAPVLLINAMMIMFIAALITALHKGLNMSCGCFASGETGESISYVTLLRDLAWLALGIYVFLMDKNPIGIGRLFMRNSHEA
jgi:uncharacterized membrane protein YphA (DoxX/SURF4 family)